MKVRFSISPDVRYYDEYAITVPPEMKMNSVPRVGDTVLMLVDPGYPQKVGLIVDRVVWNITDTDDPYVLVMLGGVIR